MADTFTKADVERIVADALKLAQGEHLKAVDELKRAAAKTEAQKEAEAARDAHRARQAALRAKARELQGADARVLKYVVGPSGAYSAGTIYRPGQLIAKPNLVEVKDPGATGSAEEREAFRQFLHSLPSTDYRVYEKGAPAPAPEKKGPLTAAEMNRADAERPKVGVVAKKSGRPSDNEV